MEITIINRPPSPAEIPEEYNKALGRGLCEMYRRLTSTPEGRAKLDAWKAAHTKTKGESA